MMEALAILMIFGAAALWYWQGPPGQPVGDPLAQTFDGFGFQPLSLYESVPTGPVVDLANIGGSFEMVSQGDGLVTSASLIGNASRQPTDKLLFGLIQQESAGDPFAVNTGSGALGLVQIMAATAVSPGFGVTPIPAGERTDPRKSINFGRQYLGAMLDRYDGNVTHALYAYNWGPGNVDNWIKAGENPADLPRETRDYAPSVLSKAQGAPLSNPLAAWEG